MYKSKKTKYWNILNHFTTATKILMPNLKKTPLKKPNVKKSSFPLHKQDCIKSQETGPNI